MKTSLPRPPFFTFSSAIQAGISPENFFQKRLSQSGDPFCVRLPGTGDIYFTACSAGAKEVFVASPDTFGPVIPNPIEPMLGQGSLILIGGDQHNRERKMINPGFKSERMRAYGPIIQEITENEVRAWQPGQILDIEQLMQKITLKVIIQAVFGVEDPIRIQKFINCVNIFSSRYTTPLFMFPFLRRNFFGLGDWNKFIEARAVFNELLDEEIEQRREKGTDSREDILSLLLQIQYEDGGFLDNSALKDQLRTILIAGHETSATGLAWAFSFLSYLPEVKEKLLTELDEIGDIPNPEKLVELPYLDAICKEGLRIHPVVPIVLRRVVKPFCFRGYDIPSGKIIGVCLSLLHHDTSIWEKPDEFIPERFLQKKYSPFEYAPFGGGARRCIGAAFANYEMKVILGTIMKIGQFDILSSPPANPRMKSITTGFRKPVFIRYINLRN